MNKYLHSTVFIVLLACLSTLSIFGQSPEGIIYQAEARGSYGALLRNRTIDVKITILADDPNGSIVWEGYHTVRTNIYGLFTLTIGEGTGGPYVFSTIDWANHAHFLNVQVYSRGRWSDMGTTQFLSVPYALHAKTAATATEMSYFNIPDAPSSLSQFINDMNFLTMEVDPVFDMHPASGINQSNISDWNTAFGWGNHSLAGYLTSFTETDPVFGIAPAATITADQLTQWNTAFGWGDHTLPGYLTDYSETDPFWTAAMADYYTKNELMIPLASEVHWMNLISIPDGFTDGVDDVIDDDNDPSNELQDLALSSHTLILSGDATTVDLTEYLDNTDAQQLSLEGNVLSLDNSPDVVLNLEDADADPQNELQALAINGDELSISDGNSVDLSLLKDGVNDADHNPSNELQTLSYDGSYLRISGGNSVRLGYPPISDTDVDEQRINWIENQLFLLNGYFIDLRDNTQYPVKKIGEQLWMAENLNFYIDPESCSESPCIIGTVDPTDPEVMTDIMYNMEAAQNACPAGWHLPTDEEWMLLEINSGMEEDYLYQEGERPIQQCDGEIPMEGYWDLMSLIFPGSNFRCDEYPGQNNDDVTFWSSIYFEDPKAGDGRILYDPIRRFIYNSGVERYTSQGNPDEYHSIRCVKDFSSTYVPEDPRQ